MRRLARLGVAGLAVASLVPCVSAQAPPVFRSAVEAVYVDVFVSRGGQPVPGLQAEQFNPGIALAKAPDDLVRRIR